MKRERLEDLGRLREKLWNIVELDILDNCESPHDFDQWSKSLHEKDKLYDAHIKIRFLKRRLDECFFLADGDVE